MRPKKITLKGITTFQNATIIDFTKFGNFFAIIGENGSGKSSIFDAMTHALFGAAAKSSKGVNLSSLYSTSK
jgi:exonuclease SbcC